MPEVNDDEGPFLDLHPSEWRREKKKDPFLGSNGAFVILLTIVAIPLLYLLSIWFEWTQNAFGTWTGIAVFLAIGIPAIFLIEPVGALIVYPLVRLYQWRHRG